MKKSAFNLTIVLKIVCAAMMVAFMVCQFLPFWTYASYDQDNYRDHIINGAELITIEKEISLGNYVWRASKHDELFGEFDEGMENFDGEPLNQNDVAMMPFLCTLLIIFGMIFMWTNKKATWPSMFPLAAGIYGTIMYLKDPANVYKIGYTYTYHLIASIAMAVVALAIFILWVISVVKWFTVKKRHY